MSEVASILPILFRHTSSASLGRKSGLASGGISASWDPGLMEWNLEPVMEIPNAQRKNY